MYNRQHKLQTVHMLDTITGGEVKPDAQVGEWTVEYLISEGLWVRISPVEGTDHFPRLLYLTVCAPYSSAVWYLHGIVALGRSRFGQPFPHLRYVGATGR
jgi:hypothetical protein